MRIRNILIPAPLACVTLLAGFACLIGCGSDNGLQTTRFLVVADSNNSRVLFYNLPFSMGQNASLVLGQTELTTSMTTLTSTGMSLPVAAAEDSAGNMYVSDFNYARVLQFRPPFSNGMSASLVIGQPDFTTATSNTTQNGLRAPGGLAFDSSGNLWVVDFGSERILQYKPPFGTGMNASLVIGQTNFDSGLAVTTVAGLTGPHYIAFDAKGNLWVTDSGNNRVLEFQPPFATGMAAKLVIGQANFGTSNNENGTSGLNFPTGISFDRDGNLWVADTANCRILEFKPPFATGMNASLVIGQSDFTSNASATTQAGLAFPFGIAFDSRGDFVVGDTSNNRTLVFTSPFSSGQRASVVVGQADFASATAATTAGGQNWPTGVSVAF